MREPMNNVLLGVNIDHVATLRQARGIRYPDPVQAALLSEEGGADGITVHLREDRRHIQERDILILQSMINTRLNLEMAPTDAMLAFALRTKPEHCCIVPENREELTTEGGLDVVSNQAKLLRFCQNLQCNDTQVSLFIDPDSQQISAARDCGAYAIELHTGQYAEAKTIKKQQDELDKLQSSIEYAKNLGLIVNAGHGLNYHNVEPIAAFTGLNELNIGHAIIARAVFTGIKCAVSEMKSLIRQSFASS